MIFKPSQWLKDRMPEGLFGRSLIISLVPMVLLQLFITYIFYERHWESVTRKLAQNTARDISVVLSLYDPKKEETAQAAVQLAKNIFFIQASFLPEISISKPAPSGFSLFSLSAPLRRELRSYTSLPFVVDAQSHKEYVEIKFQLAGGVMRFQIPHNRVFMSNFHIFFVWMVLAFLVLMGITILFLRNQVRPIVKLATAAEQFGMGRDVENFKPSGAVEVRRAARAFIEMRQRIERQITQRTILLAGVSHDLRTPLTRFKLQLALLPADATVKSLQKDVNEMQYMLEEYLTFARNHQEESAYPTDMVALIREINSTNKPWQKSVELALPQELVLPLKRQACKRCLTNLIENARAYANEYVLVRLRKRSGRVEVIIEDDGPGIPAANMEEAFRPFYRLNQSSKKANKTGTGLGLAIARDIARVHGGDIKLSRSSLGGLRAVVHFPL